MKARVKYSVVKDFEARSGARGETAFSWQKVDSFHSNRPFHTYGFRRHDAQYRDEPGKLLGVISDPRGGIWRPLDCSDGSDGADDESPAGEKG